MNRYSYCLNNPLKYIDPSGHGAVIGEDEHGNVIQISPKGNVSPNAYPSAPNPPTPLPESTESDMPVEDSDEGGDNTSFTYSIPGDDIVIPNIPFMATSGETQGKVGEINNVTTATPDNQNENRGFGEWCLRIFLLTEGGVEVIGAASISVLCYASPAVVGPVGFWLYPVGGATSWCTYILGEHWWNYFKETFYLDD